MYFFQVGVGAIGPKEPELEPVVLGDLEPEPSKCYHGSATLGTGIIQLVLVKIGFYSINT